MIKKYHIGTTQWGVKDWVGHFYTEHAKPGHFLHQYASVFNSVEGNTTFYRMPSSETVKRWGAEVPEGFKFCFKFPQSITHYKSLLNVNDDVNRFLELFDPIRKHLGPFHIQLSSRFPPNDFSKLEQLVDELPAHLAYAVEVRHPDFFDKGINERRLNELLTSYNIDKVLFDTRRLHSLISVDPSVAEAKRKKPKLPVRFDTTGNRPFLRYVGANDILNNETHLKEWAIIVADWIKEGKHPYIFIHAPDTFYAPGLIRYFHSELRKLIDLQELPVWPFNRKDRQLGLF